MATHHASWHCRLACLRSTWGQAIEVEGEYSRIVDISISNLTGVPSIIYRLLRLRLVVRIFGMAAACGRVRQRIRSETFIQP